MNSHEPPALLIPLRVQRRLRIGAGAAACTLFALSWATAGQGSWAPLESGEVRPPSVRHVVLPRVEIVARREAVSAAGDMPVECAANALQLPGEPGPIAGNLQP